MPIFIYFRVDTTDDNKISKEEFTADGIKSAIEKWVGPIEDMEAEFDKVFINYDLTLHPLLLIFLTIALIRQFVFQIDTNNGGQVLFTEFVDWALEKNLDLEDDVDSQVILGKYFIALTNLQESRFEVVIKSLN